MELFMRNINYNFSKTDLVLNLATIIHAPDFTHPGSPPLNFHVHLLKGKQSFGDHNGTGFLTLPSIEAGNRFLQIYGSPLSTPIMLGSKRILFSASRKQGGRLDVVESVRLLPYRDPRVVEEEGRRAARLAAGSISIRSLQFAWDCRDEVLSIEAEEICQDRCFLCFDEERREFRIKLTSSNQTYIIAVRFSQVESLSAHRYLRDTPVILFFLSQPPVYECDEKPFRKRLSFLPITAFERVAPYASLVMRLVCSSMDDFHTFHDLCHTAQFHRIQDFEYPIERRELFSQGAIDALQEWLRRLHWCVAFQVESIVRGLAVDVREMLDLLPDIRNLIKVKGKTYVALMLRHFGGQVKSLYQYSAADMEAGPDSVRRCFLKACDDFAKQQSMPPLTPSDGSLYEALHIIITPTTMLLEGPYPERSNRVIRLYDVGHQESFIRVSFLDEGRLQYRFDREVDGAAFILARVGPFLLDGLIIAKRKFEFLAYSQSALKEHSVWFVKEFRDRREGKVNAQTIINRLGNFDNLSFDPRLIYCPARYAARLSQAFTATDASVSVEVEEILYDADISTGDGNYHFTDGVGTLSKELAREIWTELKKTRRRARASKAHPRAFQIRFMGSKGMLSVDYRLQGRAICIRPSMTKFEAPESREIEIARAFDRPGPYFLNRPLIMLLEGLGVPFEVFHEFQERAVVETKQATQSLEGAARILESYGLGTSYRLSSIMLSLDKLRVSDLPGNAFYKKMLEFSINHILRLLKNHARIPIPGAWTLVGVADVHKLLQPGEIFACVKPLNERAIYLTGPVLISRSPTIHPGDVQLAMAIGTPPPGSCFEKEPIPNTVVFSVLGDRPLPSELGGGDLDGDVYNLIPLDDPRLAGFRPRETHVGAAYTPAQRKVLTRKSTMKDVAEFVMEYINSDVLGIIAINWLIIADQSKDRGIHDPDCITLANLHSDAVDYPKTGRPVALNAIPKLKHKFKPDWNAPETVNPNSKNYYTSDRAIGRLFRAIELPVEHQPMENTTRIPGQGRRENAEENGLVGVMARMKLGDGFPYSVIERRVQKFVATDGPSSDGFFDEIDQIFERYVSELLNICATNTLSRARNASLTEEEAIIGTIIQKTSQPRKRKDVMSKLRENTDILVRGVRERLEGDDTNTPEDFLRMSWSAWRHSLAKDKQFGAQSFGWVALGAIFEAIRQIEEGEMEARNRSY